MTHNSAAIGVFGVRRATPSTIPLTTSLPRPHQIARPKPSADSSPHPSSQFQSQPLTFPPPFAVRVSCCTAHLHARHRSSPFLRHRPSPSDTMSSSPIPPHISTTPPHHPPSAPPSGSTPSARLSDRPFEPPTSMPDTSPHLSSHSLSLPTQYLQSPPPLPGRWW